MPPDERVDGWATGATFRLRATRTVPCVATNSMREEASPVEFDEQEGADESRLDSRFSVQAEDDWIALLNFLGDVAADLLEVEDLDAVADILDATVDQIISVQYPVLYLYDEDEELLKQVWSKGFTEEETRAAEETALDRHPGWVFRNAEGFYIPDVDADPDGRTQDSPRAVDVRSRLYHPIITQGECVGAFGFGASEPNAFDREHIAALGFYSHLIGAAYGRLRRERQLRETRHDLERLNDTLRAIREVSQLIVRERDPDRILQETCELLVETQAYDYGFIIGHGDSGGTSVKAAAPTSIPPSTVVELVRDDSLGDDLADVLGGESTYFTREHDGSSLPDPVPSPDSLVRTAGMSLDYAGIVYGVLVLGSSFPEPDPREQTLLQGVANDVAFVTHMLRRETTDQLAEQALRDWLTDLPNRALFRNRLSQAIARADRSESSFALLLIDMDNLKEVNDNLGHAAGDRLLVRVSERLVGVLRDYDTVARIGGDEFTIILEDIDSDEVLQSILQRIETQLDGPFQIYGETFHTSASIGVLTYDRLKEKFDAEELDEDELMRAADRAMYKAKEIPGTQWAKPESADLRTGENIRMTNRLRKAIEEEQMVPHYQPIVSLGDDAIVGLEALARWRLDDGGTRRAGEFLETAERMGRLWEVSRQVFRRAFRDLERWRREFEDDLSLFVNLSPAGFQRRELLELFADYDVDASEVVLEITEQDLLRNPERIQELLERQFRVAVDDFGTGYSSFEYLKRFDVDCLKVDMTFVQGAPDDGTDRAILETICRLGRELGLRVVGEGVEREVQRELLVEFGAPCAQGHHFGYPVPAAEIEKRLFGEPMTASLGDEESRG